MAEKKDKKVYHYRSAFQQPTWIQKLTDKFSLPNAVRLSTIGWTVFLALSYWWMVEKIVVKIIPFPLPFWVGIGVVPIWSLAILLSDFTVEEQRVSRFLRDYFSYYWCYGRKRKRQQLNDGLLYYKPTYILKKEGNADESEK